jgi:IS30 family transposase
MEYCQLTQAERYIIASMRRQKFPAAQIALRLGRDRSTIYREVKRNKTTYNGHYGAEKAHSYATARRRRCRRKPQYSQQELAKVNALLRRRWSPQQIAGRQRRVGQLRISAQTIYRHIRRDRKAGGDLWRYTRIISKFGRKRYRVGPAKSLLAG